MFVKKYLITWNIGARLPPKGKHRFPRIIAEVKHFWMELITAWMGDHLGNLPCCTPGGSEAGVVIINHVSHLNPMNNHRVVYKANFIEKPVIQVILAYCCQRRVKKAISFLFRVGKVCQGLQVNQEVKEDR